MTVGIFWLESEEHFSLLETFARKYILALGYDFIRSYVIGKKGGKEWKGKERKGKERKGKERKGKERKGKERKNKWKELIKKIIVLCKILMYLTGNHYPHFFFNMAAFVRCKHFTLFKHHPGKMTCINCFLSTC